MGWDIVVVGGTMINKDGISTRQNSAKGNHGEEFARRNKRTLFCGLAFDQFKWGL
jgi:hypothetical protein